MKHYFNNYSKKIIVLKYFINGINVAEKNNSNHLKFKNIYVKQI